MGDKRPPLQGPSLGGDTSKGPALLAVQIVSVGIAFIAVSLRLYVRTKLAPDLGLDDVFIVLALILALVVMAFVIVSVHFGIGRHTYYVSLDDRTQGLKWSHALQPPWLFSLLFTKISICFFLLRIFSTNRKRKIALYSFIAFLVTISITIVLIPSLGYCKPRLKYWYPVIPGKCVEASVRNGINYYTTGFTISTDLVLALLPSLFLQNIHISKKIKISIGCVMALGLFTTFCAVARLVIYRRTVLGTDENYHAVDLSIWVALEQAVAIIAACIPTLGPLIKIYPGQRPHRRSSGRIFSSDHTNRRLNRPRNFHPAELAVRSDIESTNAKNTAVAGTRSSAAHDSMLELAVQDDIGIQKKTDFQLISTDRKVGPMRMSREHSSSTLGDEQEVMGKSFINNERLSEVVK